MQLFSEIRSKTNHINHLVFEGSIRDAILSLVSLASEWPQYGLMEQIHELESTYRTLLNYTFLDIHDPRQEEVMVRIKTQLLGLSDQMLALWLQRNRPDFWGKLADQDRFNEQALKELDEHNIDLQLSALLSEVFDKPSQNKPTRLDIPTSYFRQLCISANLTDFDTRLLRLLIKSKRVAWHQKCLVVSALTISGLQRFDVNKLLLLSDFYRQREPEIWQRALTGFILIVLAHRQRIALNHSLMATFIKLAQDEVYVKESQKVLLQLLRARETEKINQEFKEEILPDLNKIQSRIQSRLNTDSLIDPELFDNSNPEWENLFSDEPDLMGKLEKMSEMQMEGHDLFMSTFAQMKDFAFFNEVSNWFVPFYASNKSLAPDEMGAEGLAKLYQALEKMHYICNSDKYSFSLNLSRMSLDQRSNILALFQSESRQYFELMDSESLTNPDLGQQRTVTQYIQDLYRFFRLHRVGKELPEVFSIPWGLERDDLYQIMGWEQGFCKMVANFLLKSGRFTEAAQIFERYLRNFSPDQQTLEQTAFCYQKLKDYQKAVEYYRKADVFESKRQWNLRKMVYCYRKLGRYEEAMHWAKEAMQMEPNDPQVITLLANCCVDLSRYAEALPLYFKALEFQPENPGLLRTIAWCLFADGNSKLAISYQQKVMDETPQATDFMHYGHMLLVSGKWKQGIEAYSKALEKSAMGLDWIIRAFDEDMRHLRTYHIEHQQVQLVIDQLGYAR